MQDKTGMMCQINILRILGLHVNGLPGILRMASTLAPFNLESWH